MLPACQAGAHDGVMAAHNGSYTAFDVDAYFDDLCDVDPLGEWSPLLRAQADDRDARYAAEEALFELARC